MKDSAMVRRGANPVVFRTLEQISNSLHQCQSVLERLFPSTDVSTLQSLTQAGLLSLANGGLAPGADNQIASLSPQQGTDVESALDQLQDTPSEFDEDTPDFVADDVNALNLSGQRHSSYVGASSISAALKVISSLYPTLRLHSSLPQGDSPHAASEADLSYAAVPVVDGVTEASFVDAYFAHVHVLVPMVDEPSFRKNFIDNVRQDAPWTALMNMILALGSIAALTSQDTIHTYYYHRAKKCLGLDVFGNGRLETIQAFALLGGFYLHYCNRPNMAVAVAAASLRMACALGLHREYPFTNHPKQAGRSEHQSQREREIKRKTWWSLVCLDLWGSSTLGRPAACDHFGPAIT
jgi:hypothetical protein